MRRKLLVLAALIGLSIPLPGTEATVSAVNICSQAYCATRPQTQACACPPTSARPGAPSFCGAWMHNGACFREP